MFKFERTGKKAKKPDMTPLIDVIFQLILFFMLTTTFVKIEAIDIFVSSGSTVPPVPTHVDAAIAAPLIINLRGDNMFINNSKVTARELPAIIGRETAVQKNRAIKLMTQEGVNMQQLIDAVDLVRAGGAENISLDNAHAAEAVNEKGQMEHPPKIPLPELQSTKTANEKANSGNFNFDAAPGWTEDQ